MVWDVGVKNVYFVFVVLLVCYFNVYGIDMFFVSELIVYGCIVEEIQILIGVDWLVYQDLEDLVFVLQEGNLDIIEFDCFVFSGEYVIGDIDSDYLMCLDQK